MITVFKKFRLAFYVCVLPLLATAMVSAHSWVNSANGNNEPSIEAVSGQSVISDALAIDDQAVAVPEIVTPQEVSPFKK